LIPLPTVTWLASIQNTKVVNKGNEPRYKDGISTYGYNNAFL